MLGDPWTYAISTIVGLGYVCVAFIFKAKLIVRLVFGLCGLYLLGFGILVQSAGLFQNIAVGLLILPYVITNIFDRKLSG